MGNSIALWVKSDWRRRWISLIALALLGGLSVAVVAIALAGARRTDSSFDRLRAATHAYDNGVVIDAPGAAPPGHDHYDDAAVARIKALPQIKVAGGIVMYVASLPGADWEFALDASEDDVVGSQIESGRVLRGRLPSPQRADEVAVNEATVQRAGLDVGDVFTVETLTPDQRLQLFSGDAHAMDSGPLGPKIQLHIVGVVRGAMDVTGRSEPSLLASSALDRKYRGAVAYSSRVLLVRLHDGTTPVEFQQALDGVVSGFRLGDFDAAVEDAPARHTTHTLAIGLVVVAIAAAVVAVLALNQAVSRHVLAADADHPALVALGFTRVQRIRGAVATVVPAALGAALIVGASAFVGSRWMPVGLARRIEPYPGFDLDVPIVVVAMLSVAAVMLATAFAAAVVVTRSSATIGPSDGRTSHVATALASAGVGPVAVTGVRLAFDRRPPALPVRSTILGVGAAVVVLAGSLTFDASLGRLIRSPERWGYGWDLTLDATPQEADGMIAALEGDRDVSAASLLQTNFTLINRAGHIDGARAYGLRRPDRGVGYALRSGLQPVGPDEVVIGPELARTAHVDIGDVLDVATCPCSGDPASTTTSEVRVVGVALFPEDDAGNFNDALGFSEVGFARHVGDAQTAQVALQLARGVGVTDAARHLDTQFPGRISFFSYPIRPGEVESLNGLRSFPPVLGAVAGVLGLAALANMLLTTQQRRRRELATLRSLGFTPRAVRRCAVWQSIGVTVAAAIPAIVVGVLAGAAVWLATTRGIGVGTDASTPIGWLAMGLLVAFLIASLLGVVTGARLARAPVARSLHDE